jgi:hypothetical protein
MERVAGGMEGNRERIAHHLKCVAIMRLNGSVQDFMMARKQGGHLLWILLCQLCAAFDIGKKKRYGTGGE